MTGAGVSTGSGLPDFRSPGGLWASVDPMRVASRTAFDRDPAGFYRFYRERLDRLSRAAPNPAHHALAALERSGVLLAVITQNVDGLHHAAGSAAVIELHGNLREAVCTGCGEIRPIEVVRSALEAGTLPRCERCGGLWKPNVVLFEDLLPQDAWWAAMQAARQADVMLVAGSSLQVTPAAFLPQETLDAGGRLIIVNREPTPCDRRAAVTIHDDVTRVLPAIAERVTGSGAPGARDESGYGEEPLSPPPNSSTGTLR
ncbi:MAG: Sir2 family NAD-dependent protein deacetylase [Armatimonadetes bacterium]|nr:Sir2 family NAD-dependent protein deacetylase [Armatimonadota bacterium]